MEVGEGANIVDICDKTREGKALGADEGEEVAWCRRGFTGLMAVQARRQVDHSYTIPHVRANERQLSGRKNSQINNCGLRRSLNLSIHNVPLEKLCIPSIRGNRSCTPLSIEKVAPGAGGRWRFERCESMMSISSIMTSLT